MDSPSPVRNLSSEHGEREGEAGYPLAGGALPQEGATRAPEIASPLKLDSADISALLREFKGRGL